MNNPNGPPNDQGFDDGNPGEKNAPINPASMAGQEGGGGSTTNPVWGNPTRPNQPNRFVKMRARQPEMHMVWQPNGSGSATGSYNADPIEQTHEQPSQEVDGSLIEQNPDWVDANDPRSVADLQIYLAKRPLQDTSGSIHDPNNGRFVNPDAYFEEQRKTHEEKTQAPYEEMGSLELARALAEAEVHEDQTAIQNVSDALLEKLAAESKKLSTRIEGTNRPNNDGDVVDPSDALWGRVMRYKDNYVQQLKNINTRDKIDVDYAQQQANELKDLNVPDEVIQAVPAEHFFKEDDPQARMDEADVLKQYRESNPDSDLAKQEQLDKMNPQKLENWMQYLKSEGVPDEIIQDFPASFFYDDDDAEQTGDIPESFQQWLAERADSNQDHAGVSEPNNENQEDEPQITKLSFRERASFLLKRKAMEAYTALFDHKRGVVAAGIGLIAVAYITQKTGLLSDGHQDVAAQLGNNQGIGDGLSDLGTMPPPKSQIAQDAASSVPAPGSPPVETFDVQPGDGFTNIIQDAAEKKGISLSGNESYQIYLDNEKELRELTNTYTMSGGEVGIADPARNVTLPPEVIDAIENK